MDNLDQLKKIISKEQIQNITTQIKEKGKTGDSMAVSKAIIPVLQDNEAKIFMDALNKTKLSTYSEKQSQKTMLAIEKIYAQRRAKIETRRGSN